MKIHSRKNLGFKNLGCYGGLRIGGSGLLEALICPVFRCCTDSTDAQSNFDSYFFLKLYTHGNMGMAWLVRFDCFDF